MCSKLHFICMQFVQHDIPKTVYYLNIFQETFFQNLKLARNTADMEILPNKNGQFADVHFNFDALKCSLST